MVSSRYNELEYGNMAISDAANSIKRIPMLQPIIKKKGCITHFLFLHPFCQPTMITGIIIPISPVIIEDFQFHLPTTIRTVFHFSLPIYIAPRKRSRLSIGNSPKCFLQENTLRSNPVKCSVYVILQIARKLHPR